MPDTEFPKWYYGPKGTADVFEASDDVPEGWVDHPSKLGDVTQDPAPAPTTEPLVPAGASVIQPEGEEELDKSGWAWDASRNTANRGKTQSGLWQLLPGQSRPAPQPGFPKEEKDFDL